MSGHIVGWCVDAAGYWPQWYARLVDLWESIKGSRGSICAVKTVIHFWIYLLDILALVMSRRT